MDIPKILYGITLAILAYMVILNLVYSLNLVMAAFLLPNRSKRYRMNQGIALDKTLTKAISILVPAFNEEKTIIDSVNSLLSLDYEAYEIIVANDGSSDGTLQKLIDTFKFVKVDVTPNDVCDSKPIRAVYYSEIEPKLVLVDKENGGKADAQNGAARVARYPHVLLVDADTLLDPESLQNLAIRLTAEPHTVALGGIVRVVNGCTVENGTITNVAMPRRYIERIQVLEYFRAFLFGRMSFAAMNALVIISGAFGVFRWDAFSLLRGWNPHAIGEDVDAVTRLQKDIYEKDLPWRVNFAPSPVSWTQVPVTWKSLGTQRDRWQRGLMQVVLENKRMIFNPRYGNFGLVGFPFFAIFEMLSALIEFLCYPLTIAVFALGIVDLNYMVYFLALVLVWGLCISFATIWLHEFVQHRYGSPGDLKALILIALAENFGFRQIHSYWRLRGTIRYIFDPKTRTTGHTGWEVIEREGFSA